MIWTSFLDFLRVNANLIDMFCNIFIALGTVGAVVVALYFSYRGNHPKPKIKLYANIQYYHYFNDQPGAEGEKYVYIEAANLSVFPVTINCSGWRIGFFSKKYFFQMPNVFDRVLSSQMPVTISYGQDAHIFIGYDIFLKDAGKIFPTSKCKLLNWIRAKSYRVVVKDNLGNSFHSSFGRDLQAEILKIMFDGGES